MILSSKWFCWPRILENIHKKGEECVPGYLSGKNIKLETPSTGKKNNLPSLQEPNEETQLDFVGPNTFKNRKVYIFLAVDRFSKWPSASITKTSSDGKSVIEFMRQISMVHGNPKNRRKG